MKYLKKYEKYISADYIHMSVYKNIMKKYPFKINDIVKYNSVDGFFKVTIIDTDDPSKTYQITNIDGEGDYYWVYENEITLVKDYELAGRNYNL